MESIDEATLKSMFRQKREILFHNENFSTRFNGVWFAIKVNKETLTRYETFQEFNTDNNEILHWWDGYFQKIFLVVILCP